MGSEAVRKFTDWLADPVPLTLDLLNPKSIGFDRLSRTTAVLRGSSHSDQGFSFYLSTNILIDIRTA